MSKKTKGRQKLEMVKIPNENNLSISFSKRKRGIFNKANELATLCGAEIAIVIFSPGKNAFSFGHPSLETVINRFLSRDPSHASRIPQLKIRDLNMKLSQALTQLEKEKKQGEELQLIKKSSNGLRLWETPTNELDLPSVEQLKTYLEVVKENATKRLHQLLTQMTDNLEFDNPSSSSGAVPSNPKNDGFNDNMMGCNYNLGLENENGSFELEIGSFNQL